MARRFSSGSIMAVNISISGIFMKVAGRWSVVKMRVFLGEISRYWRIQFTASSMEVIGSSRGSGRSSPWISLWRLGMESRRRALLRAMRILIFRCCLWVGGFWMVGISRKAVNMGL